MSTPVRILQMFYFVKMNLWLILHDAELTNPVIYMDFRIPDRIYRHKPLVIVPTVGTINHTLMIRLNDSKILERGTSGTT